MIISEVRDSKKRNPELQPSKAGHHDIRFLMAMDLQRTVDAGNTEGYGVANADYWRGLIEDPENAGTGVYVLKEGFMYIGFLAVSAEDIANSRQVPHDALYVKPCYKGTLAYSNLLDYAEVSVSPMPIPTSTTPDRPAILASA